MSALSPALQAQLDEQIAQHGLERAAGAVRPLRLAQLENSADLAFLHDREAFAAWLNTVQAEAER